MSFFIFPGSRTPVSWAFGILFAAFALSLPDVRVQASEVSSDGLRVSTRERRDFRSCPPVSNVMPLQSGQPVEFPICYENARSFAVEGRVETAVMDQELARYGLSAVPFEEDRALVRWYFLDYEKTTIGPYREAFIGVVASTDRKECGMMQLLRMWSGMPGSAPSDVGIFEYRLWVDQALPLAAGNELLGTEKQLAEIQMNRDGTRFSGSLRDGVEQAELSFDQSSRVFHREAFGNNLDFMLFTKGRKAARTRFKGKSLKAKWEKVGRDWHHPALEALDFQPKSILISPQYDGALYSPSLNY